LLNGNRPPEDITVIMGQGNEEKVKNIGTVKGNAINKNGKLQGSLIYLMLSVTKIMNSGLKPEGDEISISFVSDKKKLTFYIKIHIARGVLLAVKFDK
jgi:hypothetical protein